VYQKLLAKTSNYSIAMLASRAAAFILLPVYTHYLRPSDYGVLELLDLLASITGLLVGVNLGQGLFYFYFSAETDAARARWISAALFGAILLGSVAGLAGILLAAPISNFIFGNATYSSYVTLSLLALSVSVTSEVGYCFMRTLERVSHYVTTSLVTLGLSIILNVILLVGFQLGVKGIQISALVTGVGLAAYMIIYISRHIPISLDPVYLVRMIRYSMPLAIGGLGALVIHYGDRMFLRHRISLSELGIYSLGYKIGMLVAFCHAPFIMHWNSQVSALVRGPDAGRIFARASRYLAAALISVVVLLSVFVKPLLDIMVAPAFRMAYVLVPWIAFAYLLRSFGAHMQSVFIIEGRPQLEARANILGAICCVTGYALLIPPFKTRGAVAATIAGFLVVLIYSYYEAWRLRRFTLEFGRIGRMLLFGTTAIVAFYGISPVGFVNEVGLASVCTAVYGSLLFYCAGFDAEERESAQTLILSFLKRGQADAAPVVETTCGRQ
jgi:O-antigen/teichoic acid export membrane protein